MINYHHFTLDNGLKVYVHEDNSSKIAVVNILYKVGSRNERLGKTGLAHYFEHLMFGSSKNVPVFDAALERVGGSSNAFTNTDITNFYITLPAINVETAFWLESDRMLQLTLSEKTIETQRKVVIEEFKQRYLNQPYGDVYHHLRETAYLTHPYQWPTIGKTIEDIIGYNRVDVEEFYASHYCPDNAILVIAGGVSIEQAKRLSEKWFGNIPSGQVKRAGIQQELPQKEKRTKEVFADVPTDTLYKTYRMPGILEKGYVVSDLISDILGFGRSSMLEQKLVKNGNIFASVNAYVLGTVDPGLLVFTGKMEKGKTAQEAERELDAIIEEFKNSPVLDSTLTKVKNQAEAMKTYEAIQLLNRAMTLAFYAHLGNPDLYQDFYLQKKSITSEDILELSKEMLVEENSTVLYYRAQQ
jgi:zinc protease